MEGWGINLLWRDDSKTCYFTVGKYRLYPQEVPAFRHGEYVNVINTQDDEMAEFEPDLLNEQIKWLENDLATTDKKWKVVLMHRDILNYGRDAKPLGDEISFSRHGEIYMPIFDKYDVDAVLTAHLHTYRRRALIRDFAQNEQGTLYILTGVAGNVRYPSLPGIKIHLMNMYHHSQKLIII